MVANQTNKGTAFLRLHMREGAFVIPNPWDIGTARILASMGFQALATTSAGMAFALGLPKGAASREQVIKHCRDIVAATDLPVSADLEKGFGDTPESVAETVQVAAEVGLAGCSIEDHTGRKDDRIFEFDLAVERIQAAVEAARQLPHDFVLTARCENFLWNRPDLGVPRRTPQGPCRPLQAHLSTAPGHRGRSRRGVPGRCPRPDLPPDRRGRPPARTGRPSLTPNSRSPPVGHMKCGHSRNWEGHGDHIRASRTHPTIEYLEVPETIGYQEEGPAPRRGVGPQVGQSATRGRVSWGVLGTRLTRSRPILPTSQPLDPK
jgi:hypothetical protein